MSYYFRNRDNKGQYRAPGESMTNPFYFQEWLLNLKTHRKKFSTNNHYFSKLYLMGIKSDH